MPVNRIPRRFVAFLGFLMAAVSFYDATARADEQAAAGYKVLAFGDSLTAGYGLGPGEGFTDVLQDWLNAHMDAPVTVVNGGVSGDTTTGGRSRLDWALAPFKDGKPDLVILTLGGNDGLRGIDPTITRDNIDAMVKTLSERGIPVLLAGMMAPPNLGEDYAAVFNPAYPDTAKRYGVPFYPFFLDGVAADPALNQADGIHPNPAGVKIIVDRIAPMVQAELLR
ncbi:MAG: arylesterase [Alphaproteobacteria bacterium]|nr:MAG: arylesterase [Alphaproteobacteria bacterium]